MRKFFISLLLTMLAISTYAQLKMAQFPEDEEKGNKTILSRYDSLTNIVKINGSFEYLKGQKITSISSADFDAFISCPGVKSYNKREYLKQMDGKTFHFTSVIGNIISLQEEENPSNIINMSFNSEYSWMADLAWVSHGYFEKIKELYLNKELVYIHKDDEIEIDFYSYDRFMDYDTKREVKRIMPRNSKWKCTDVMVLPGKQQFSDCSNRVILNIENEKYGKYYIFASELIKLKEWKNERFIFHEDFLKLQEIQRKKNAAAKAKAEAEAKMYAERQAEKNKNIIEKYGSYYGNLIIQGRVVIGMTKEMCREAWGEPKDINRTETAWTIHEQWVYYGNRYLYFENDKLTTIQN